jgi:hypothetical protein
MKESFDERLKESRKKKMGVPGLYRWIREKFRQLVIRTALEGDLRRISSLIFDANGLIHNVAARVFGYDPFAFGSEDEQRRLQAQLAADELQPHLVADFKAQVFEAIRFKAQLHRPDQLVVMIDGVPPMAKVQQQRLRRFRAGMRSSPVFDSNAITPGTQLMTDLTVYLREQLASQASTLNTDFVLFSGPNDPGEGEHKFMALLRESRIGGPYTKLIHGLDADLILLSLLLPPQGIILLHEEQDGRTEYLLVDALRQTLQLHLATPTAITDFVALCFLVGNDFAPRPLAAAHHVTEIIDDLINIYVQLKRPLTDLSDGPRIRWENYAGVIARLAEKEPKYADEVLTGARLGGARAPPARARPREIFQPTWLAGASRDAAGRFDYEAFRANWYSVALSLNPGITARDLGQFASLMGFRDSGGLVDLLRPAQESVTRLCTEYLGMLAWSFHYYVRGAQLPRVPPEVREEARPGALRRAGPPEAEEPAAAPETLLSLAAFYPNLHAPLYSDLAIVAAAAPPPERWHLAGGAGSDPAADRRLLEPLELLLAVLPPGRSAVGRAVPNPLVPRDYQWLMLPQAAGGVVSVEQLLAAVPEDARAEAIERLNEMLRPGASEEERQTEAYQRAYERATAKQAFGLFVSVRARPERRARSIVLAPPAYHALNERFHRRETAQSPIFDLFPVEFPLERYLAEPSGEIPRIPLADARRIHEVYEAARAGGAPAPAPLPPPLAVRTRKRGCRPQSPQLTIAQRYVQNRAEVLRALNIKRGR